MAGIVGYGAHLPRHRIKVEEIAKVWGADAPSYKKGLMLREKSVPPPDMDTITLAVEATRNALLRIVTGFLIFWHGTQKLFGVPIPAPPQLPSFVIAIAGPIELVGGLLVMIGLFAGWAAFLCSGLMAFAYWMIHGTQALLPIQNRGELAVLFCFIFLFISSQGSGIWSVDAARKGT